MAELEKAIRAVQEGVFVPDAIRGRRFPPFHTPALDSFYAHFGQGLILDAIKSVTMDGLCINVPPAEP